jgi:hypothetical protein
MEDQIRDDDYSQDWSGDEKILLQSKKVFFISSFAERHLLNLNYP